MGVNYSLGPRLTTVCRTHRKDVNGVAEALESELVLEPQSTECESEYVENIAGLLKQQ